MNKDEPMIAGLIVEGMTLRDWFAGHALVGLLIDVSVQAKDEDIEMTCKDAYHLADAMLEERNK